MIFKEKNKQEQNWEEKFNLLVEYINSSEKIKNEFNKTGNVERNAVLKKGERTLNIGVWINSQKQNLMKKYQGMTIEKILQDESTPKKDKYRMEKLLNLGVSYPNIKAQFIEENWNEKFELLQKYINSSEEAKKYLEKKGSIDVNAKIEFNNEVISIGSWLHSQKNTLMKKYQGMSIEEIRKDTIIPEEDKNRIIKLLSLGIKYANTKGTWEENLEILEKYINSSKESKEFFKETGRIKKNVIIKKNGKDFQLMAWLHQQRTGLMKKYQGMSIEEIKEDTSIPKNDKNKMIKLLELGVSYINTSGKSREELWEENYELLKNYINSSEDIKKHFEENGNLIFSESAKKDKKIVKIDVWLYNQIRIIRKKYQGKSIEEIRSDDTISKEHKYKIAKLYQLADFSKFERQIIENENWNEKFDLLVKYINSSEDIKNYFKENGIISQQATIEKDNEKIKIGRWLNYQKQNIMRRYQGMSIEEIEKDITIPKDDKYKMKKLLELGASYSTSRIISYDDQWEEKFELLVEYINSNEKVKKFFEKKGRLPSNRVVEKNGNKVNLGEWLVNQKYYLIERNGGKSINNIDEVINNESFSETEKNKAIKLLELGAKLKLREKSSDEIWEEKFELLKEYINSSEENKENFQLKGSIKYNAIIEKDGEIINVGTWLMTQRAGIMRKYQGKSIEEIEKDIAMPKEDKYKIMKLLKLGVSYRQIKGNDIGKSSYDSNVEICDNAQQVISRLKEKKEKTTSKI